MRREAIPDIGFDPEKCHYGFMTAMAVVARHMALNPQHEDDWTSAGQLMIQAFDMMGAHVHHRYIYDFTTDSGWPIRGLDVDSNARSWQWAIAAGEMPLYEGK